MVRSHRNKAAKESESNDQRHSHRQQGQVNRTGQIGRRAGKSTQNAANSVAEDESALLRADTFTNAPKVSHRTLTKEEREELVKQEKSERQEEQRLAEMADKGPLARWWIRVQRGRDKVSLGMAIVALGVVYGDIGTSPLYTAQTFLAGQGGLGNIDRGAVLGMLSLVFWSITLITTVKYVLIALRVDNNGEGGIFALYSLIRKYGAWLTIPAMLGGAAFLA
ncbi:KUP/HAK/KT family potassium transporter, partial [Bifidobacterium sp.]|uniref:KUP/HAK/KT family potassium transporter n=1 Tax=Bifidobacterium sp. TaxID=41200 RepID=UPI0025C094E6